MDDQGTERELPRVPNENGLNLHPNIDNIRGSFDILYRDYRNVATYADAKAAFESKALTPKPEMGVNTWHEQVLAGRVTLDEIKALGMSRLGRASRDPKIRYQLLAALALPESKTDVALVRLAWEMVAGAKSDSIHVDATILRFALFFVRGFGPDAARLTRFVDVYDVAATEIKRTLGGPPVPEDRREAAWELAVYVDEFTAEHADLSSHQQGGQEQRPFMNSAFSRLLRAGVAARDAAALAAQGMSVERVIEAQKVARPLADGAL